MATYYLEEALAVFSRHIKARNSGKYGRLNISEALNRLWGETKKGLAEKGIGDDLLSEATQLVLQDTIDSLVASYVRNKQTLCLLYSDFSIYLKAHRNIDLSVPTLHNYKKDTFSTQLEIVKALHGNGLTTCELAERLDISQQATRKHLREMSSPSPNEGLFIQDEKVKIVYVNEKRRYSSPNTVHPLLLTASVRQVWAMLEGLFLTNQGDHPQYALDMASNIWAQLSAYGKGRIKKMRLKPELKEWIALLEERTKPPIFQTEEEIFEQLNHHGIVDIDFFYKSGLRCNLEYRDGDRTVSIKCKVLSPCGIDGIGYRVVDEKGVEHTILISNIISTKPL